MKDSRVLRWILLTLSLLIAIPLLEPVRVLQLPLSSKARIAVRSRVLEFATYDFPIAPDPRPVSCFWIATIPNGALGRFPLAISTTLRSKIWPAYATMPAEVGPIGAAPALTTLRVLTIPLLPPALLLFVATLFCWLRYWRRPAKPGLCSQCGYDLTGNASGACPECGRPVPRPPPSGAPDATLRSAS